MSCPDDEALSAFLDDALPAPERARLAAHLAGCDDCRALVAGTARQGPLPGEPRPPAIGDVVGRFRLVEQLGAGAFGVVFGAVDAQLGRKVAVKFLGQEVADVASAQARMLLEAQAAARLAHPNVAALYDVGEHHGRIFLAQEWVQGHRLREWARDRPLPQVVDAFVQGARGLAAVHAAGVLHRDVKPDNVVIGDTLKLVDFGLARASGAQDDPGGEPVDASEVDSQATRVRTRGGLGTPAYMAPEQLAGEPASELSDQYAMCLTFAEALLGHRPQRPFVWPDRLPRWLVRVLERGLAASPSGRFASLAQLARALERGQGAAGRTRRLVAAVAALAVIAGTGTALALRAPRRAVGEPLAGTWDVGLRLRTAARFAASHDGKSIAAGRRLISRMDEAAADLTPIVTAPPRGGELGRAQATCILLRRAELEATVASVFAMGPADLLDADRLAGELVPASDCNDDRRLKLIADGTRSLGAQQLLALRRALKALDPLMATRQEEAAMAHGRVLLAEVTRLGSPTLIAETQLKLGRIHTTGAHADEARQAFRAALEAAGRAGDERLQVLALMNLGHLELTWGDPPGATVPLTLAASMADRLGDVPWILAPLRRVQAIDAMQAGRVEQSWELVQEAYRQAQKAMPPDAPEMAFYQLTLGRVAQSAEHYAEAAGYVERAMALWQSTTGGSLARYQWQLASIWVTYGDLVRGQSAIDAASAEYATTLPPDHADILTVDVSRMGLLVMRDQWAAADQLVRDLRARVARSKIPLRPAQEAGLIITQADIEEQGGLPPLVSSAQLETLAGDAHSGQQNTATAERMLAQRALRAGDVERAREHLRRGVTMLESMGNICRGLGCVRESTLTANLARVLHDDDLEGRARALARARLVPLSPWAHEWVARHSP